MSVPAFDPNELLNQTVGDLTKNVPLAEGVYHVRLAKKEYVVPKPPVPGAPVEYEKDGVTPKEKFPYYNLQWVVTGDSPEESHGRMLFEIASLKPGATFTLRQIAEAIGMPEDANVFVAVENNVPILNEAFNDCECLLVVAIQAEGKGKDGKWYAERNAIKKHMPLGS
jgi:hypothetical protein